MRVRLSFDQLVPSPCTADISDIIPEYSDTRLDDLPAFYRPASALTWNGTPYQGAEGVRQLLEKMPPTKHEVQSFDCHPIPG